MSVLRVDTAAGTLAAFDRSIPCAIGRGGALPAAAKREGDGATPLGRWPLLAVLLRPDRVGHPGGGLPWRWLRPDDGWSDDATDPAYNRPVRHPHRWSAERLWREDGLYDVIVVLGHNLPPVPGAGSAIFLHCRHRSGDRTKPAEGCAKPTEGCIAIERAALLDLLPLLAPGDAMTIA